MIVIFAAHINKKDEIQTVTEHSYGVKEKSKKYAEKINASRIAELTGLIHDIGKLCKIFNDYIRQETSMKRGEIDHSYAGAKYICSSADKLGSKYYDVSRFIAHTIVSHHGIHDWYDEDGNDYLKKRISFNKNYSEILENIGELTNELKIKELLSKAKTEYELIQEKIDRLCQMSGKNTDECKAFYCGMFERFMQSVLIDADRNDTADFMSGTSTEKLYSNDELQNIWCKMNISLEEKIAGFSHKIDEISVQRKNISDRCKQAAKNKPGIYRLIVPTGGGKTLSSLRYAINVCIKHGMEKIIYAAPFMSILEQNSDEICSVVGKENFIEHHSNALMDINDAEELSEYELRTEKWDLPVIATTTVQLLNALFSGKMQSVRRMHRLSRAVIIIDEVQSIPLKCISIFNLAMNFLSEICGCTIVLCSATQPIFENTKYPMLLNAEQSITGDYTKDFEIFRRTEIIPEIQNYKYGMTYDETAAFCHEKYEKSGNLLVIVNTKNSAKRIYELMKNMSYSKMPEIIHISTNMCPAHRRKIINKMRENINAPVICITTQLIEAGVDISFRCVIRALAGLDNVVQAAGRCNRHGEESEFCPVYMIDIKDENLNRLKEIKRAKNITRQIIARPEINDYTDPKVLNIYYKNLFKEAESELEYNIKKYDTTLLELLSLNSDRHNIGLNDDYNDANLNHAQAFKTAGDCFDVIDAETIGILVPYNEEAEKMINALESDIEPNKAMEIMRHSQKYTVSVYKSMFKLLNENGALIKMDRMNILRKENYNSELGIILEDTVMDFLIY